MKVTFVYPQHENYGIEILSSVLKNNGHKTSLAFDPMLQASQPFISLPSKLFNYKKILLEEVINSKPDLVAFSVLTDIYTWSCEIAEEIKKRINVPIIFGGIHVSAVPEKIIKNDFVDMICIGEGEYALLELANNMEKEKDITKIKNIWVKQNRKIYKNEIRPLIQNLDELPFADKDLFYDKFPLTQVCYNTMTARGCPFSCTYCCNDFFRKLYSGKGKYVRRRSVDNVIEELRIAKEKMKFREVNFLDDVFAFDKKWLREFSKKYKKIDLPFRCSVNPNTADNETINILKKTGCNKIFMGVQSINEKTRRNILNRFESNEQIKKVSKTITDVNIELLIDHIAGIPYETEQDLIDALKFYKNMKFNEIFLYWLTYYPKVSIIETAKKAGIINNKDIKKMEDGISDVTMISEDAIKKIKKQNTKSKIIDIHNKDTYIRFLLLFKLIKFLPQKFINFLLEKKRYEHIPIFTRKIFLVIQYCSTFLKSTKPKIMAQRLVELTNFYFKVLKNKGVYWKK